MDDCRFCDLYENGHSIGGNSLYRVIVEEEKVYAIWKDHGGIWEFPHCTSKLMTMKIDAQMLAAKELGGEVKTKNRSKDHIYYEMERL